MYSKVSRNGIRLHSVDPCHLDINQTGKEGFCTLVYIKQSFYIFITDLPVGL